MADEKIPLLPESGKDVGPHDGPSPDPHGRVSGEGRAPVEPEGDAGAVVAGDGDEPPVPGSQTDVIHVEDDRIR